ncbi:hypothetical protein [Natrinema salifodinae]|uniref:Sulfatase n=1 Tax=Natrinema salifodinae TaxID=1202768 RepID=A0A1I0Q6V9_9EURY|nr:hypothetical protein [Natrinema salifodinae]SEW22728.1 hypothetical protein SAMN05216285_3168 [Natrinema salifodinae]
MDFTTVSERLATGQLGRSVSRLVPATPIWEREWDVCCVLDGCRLDLMRETAAAGHRTLPDPEAVGSLWSVGSQSAEWMDRTFAPRYREEMARTAYVTGNPFSSQSCEHILVTSDEVLPLSADDFGVFHEAWRDEWVDDDISTIPPDSLTDAAIAIWRRREELGVDRVLIHYMQPHAPFRSRAEWFFGSADIEHWGQFNPDDGDGDEATAVDGETEDDALDLADLTPEEREALEAFADADDDGADSMNDPWLRVRDGNLSFDAVWAAYRDNLEWALDDLTRLLANCDGRVALTSDHGNGLGEFGVWSHPPGTPVPAVRRVPWVVREGTDRGTCEPGLPDAIRRRDADRDGDGDDIESRLEALGYR